MEDNLKKHTQKGRRPKNQQNARRPKKIGRQPQFLLAYNHSTKINLIGCDTIVNSPSG